MSRSKLKYLSVNTLNALYEGILENIERYRSGDFDDLVAMGGWNIDLSIEVNLDLLSGLDPSGGPDAEVNNSLIVWKALHEITPAMACEDRIWTRLSHVECLDFSRERWLRKKDDAEAAKEIRKHFFAPGLTACRDDHSISRLWWNAKIAKDLRPNDQKAALKLILQKADIRSNFIERSWTVSRPKVANSILRVMERETWVTEKEGNYRNFMMTLNRLGGGVVFELLSDEKLDHFMDRCYQAAIDKTAD